MERLHLNASSPPQEDTVAELKEIPAPEPGSPAPVALCREGEVLLVYRTTRPPSGDGPPSTIAASVPSGTPTTVAIRFVGTREVSFGGPNDETLAAHPLYSRGLGFYAAHQVLRSTWLRTVQERNSVHPRHSPDLFASARHFIITFHDSTFECLADSFTLSWHTGAPLDVIAATVSEMARSRP